MRSLVLWLTFLLIFTIPWENAITLTGFGTFTRVIGIATFVLWGISVLVKGKVRKPRIFHVLFFLFVLINIVSILWTYDLTETRQRIITYVQLFAFTLILWDLFSTPAVFQTGLQAYILGAYITIGSSVINYIKGETISTYEIGRYAGASLNANDLALILALGLPIAWKLAISTGNDNGSRILKVVNYLYIPSALFAIILTASRMSLFAVAPALVYIFLMMSQIKLGFRVVAFGGLTGIIIVLKNYIPQASIDRLASVSTSIINFDLGGRVAIWLIAISVFLEHPFLGVGSGALRIFTNGAAHNTFLSVLADLGIFGFIFFISILGIVFYGAIRQPKSFSALWLSVLAIWMIGVSTLTWEFYKPTWLFLSFIVISENLFLTNRK